MDLILTGASRGIGAALTAALAQREHRLFLIARDEARLSSLARQCRDARVFATDLSSVKDAAALGARLAGELEPGAVLVHNAGIWPSQRALTSEGYERAYAVNHLAPLALQAPLLEKKCLRRVLVVSAGLMVKGRIDAKRTPTGEDFSSFRTYATTKRCFAEATRALAPRHPEVDFALVHPGVVNTELGARTGPLGWLLKLVKRNWETPEVCAARLARLLDVPRWSKPGEASWYFEDRERPWPL
jgi:NAD(P)-dependent dehydrogenase (short-subunit alcohol dehydrogenase family)